MEAKAIAKGVRIAPRKCRLVVDLIRNKSVVEADRILSNINKEAARLTRKVLISATANAENNLGMDVSKLYVEDVQAGQAPVMKRIRPRGKGSANRILKRTCHISIILNER